MIRQSMISSAAGLMVAITTVTVLAEKRPFAPVPPSLEIEVLDPGVDPDGNPAVRLRGGNDGETQVDIPPVILVHRYYYSGDRSFQGPMLPGGPSILVVNHPRTGERCYIPAQMMPGAPRVTYTKNGIDYDYGEHAITLSWYSREPFRAATAAFADYAANLISTSRRSSSLTANSSAGR